MCCMFGRRKVERGEKKMEEEFQEMMMAMVYMCGGYEGAFEANRMGKFTHDRK